MDGDRVAVGSLDDSAFEDAGGGLGRGCREDEEQEDEEQGKA